MGMYPKATGALIIYRLNHDNLQTLAVYEKSHGIKCSAFGASALDDQHLATSDYKDVLSIWDVEKADVPLYSTQAHKSIINAIDCCGDQDSGSGAPEIVTGGRDGYVRVWDVRVAEPVVTLPPKKQDSARGCWSVCFGNSYSDAERCVVSGYGNGDVKMLDLRTNSLRWETNCQNSVVDVQFDRKDIEMSKLMVTTLDSKFYVYDLQIFHPEQGFVCMTEKAHKSAIWQGCFLPQNRDLFMTGGCCCNSFADFVLIVIRLDICVFPAIIHSPERLRIQCLWHG